MRRIVVQKFGGTSVATPEVRERVVHHIERALNEGAHPVVVVSAMGRRGDPYATDTLLTLVESIGGEADSRETDLLLACGEVISTVVLAQTLRSRGHAAKAFTGGQAGIVTTAQHGNARIIRVEPDAIKEVVEAGIIPIIAGFQGVDAGGEVTTLGRGGSDTSAAALAVGLNAALLEVYTDVDGVKTADPRLAPDAATLDHLTYREVVEMAHLGAKVIHPRAVEIAMLGRLPLHIRPTTSDAPGTLVCDPPASQGEGLEHWAEERPVTGIAHVAGQSLVQIDVPPDGSEDAPRQVFQALGEASVSADMIYVSPDRIAFIVEGNAAKRIERLLEKLGFTVRVRSGVAKVSAVGAGMHGVPGVMGRIAASLCKAGIPILQTTDSHANISCLVPGERMQEAVLALHREFELATDEEASTWRPDRMGPDRQ